MAQWIENLDQKMKWHQISSPQPNTGSIGPNINLKDLKSSDWLVEIVQKASSDLNFKKF